MLRMTRIGGLLLAFIGIAGLSAYLTLTLIIKQENTVIVPDLVGKDVVEVLFLLTDLGLNTKVGGAEYTADMPANRVVYQDPKPGDAIKKDRDIRIVISKGPKTVQTPNLVGLPLAQARLILEENRLCSGVRSYVFNAGHRKDDIVAHSPAHGRIVSRGTCVDLLVGNGRHPAAFKMPDLDGLALAETLLLLEAVELRLGNVRPAAYRNKPWNSIVSQEPLPGHRITEGSRVDLAVNRSDEEWDRESVSGLAGAHLFRYRTPVGFLKRHIRVRLDGFGGSVYLSDDFLKPREEIWHLVPADPGTSILLYEDGAVAAGFRDEWKTVFGFNPAEFEFALKRTARNLKKDE